MQKYKISSSFFMLFFSLLSYCVSSAAQERLIFAIDLIRHGDRTPIHETHIDPYPWKEGLAQLTPQGMQRAYQLGVEFRKKYIEQLQLLPHSYEPNIIYVRSTNKDRALTTAQAVLLGLYPLGTGPKLENNQPALPDGFQPIPIHSVTIHDDYLLQTKMSKNPLYWPEYLTAWYKASQKVNAAFKQKIPGWSKTTGLPLNDLKQMKVLADILYVRQSNQVPLPKGISAEDATQIITLGKNIMVQVYKTKAISYPMARSFLLEVKTYMQQILDNQTSLKYVLFSAHDSTIMSVMTALGNPVDKIPFYASHLNFALYEENQRHFIRILFNNEPVNIATCQGGHQCTLEEFYALTEGV